MDSGRYLDMPIPTIKHVNLNRYERILTADPESRRKICTISYTKQLAYRLILHKEMGRRKRSDEHLYRENSLVTHRKR